MRCAIFVTQTFYHHKSVLAEISHKVQLCFFTDFVTFSNTQNDSCFVKQTFFPPKVCFSLVNKTDIVTSVAKSDEIGKTTHFV